MSHYLTSNVQTKSTPQSFHFDEQKILAAETSEKRELFMFQWLSSLEKDLTKVDSDVLRPYQSDLEKTLLKIVNLTDPKPNRPIRHITARCFVNIYEKGETRSLFDTLCALQMALSNKKLDDSHIKLALTHCIGTISEFHGSKMLSLFPETVNLYIKQLKAARDSEISIRHETLFSLNRAIKGAGKALTDPMLKECIRFCKNGIADKIPVIRTVSAQLYESLYLHTSHSPPRKFDEYEYLLLPMVKAFEGSDFNQRKAIASLIATILASSQAIAPPVKETAGRFARFLGGNTLAAEANETLKKFLECDEMLSVFIALIPKVTSREARVGVFEAYAILLGQLGVSFLEANYAIILSKILELMQSPKASSNQVEFEFIKESCGFLVRDIIGRRLSEAGQIHAIKELVHHWLRKWPAVGNEAQPSDEALCFVLDEVAELLYDLGPAASSALDVLFDPLAVLLSHSSQSVNLSLSWCLRCLCTSLPDQLSRMISKVVGLLQRDTGPSCIDKIDNMDRIIGYGNALASLICVIPQRPLYISYESAAIIFGISNQLIKAAGQKETALSAVQSLVAWTLVGALMTLGPNFVKVHLSQLLLIWKNYFPKLSSKESVNRTELEWNSLLISRYASISALYSFLLHNKELLTSDITKRIVVFLNNSLSFVNHLPTSYASAMINHGIHLPMEAFRMKLIDREALIRARIFQCYCVIDPNTFALIGTQLLSSSLDFFLPDPERLDRWAAAIAMMTDKAPQTEVAIQSSKLVGFQVFIAQHSGSEDRGIGKILRHDTDLDVLEALMDRFSFSNLEYDPAALFLNNGNPTKPKPLCASIILSDACLELFSILFPLQNASQQESILESMMKATRYSGPKVTQSRKTALQINAFVSIIGALKCVISKKGTLASVKVLELIKKLVGPFISSADSLFRVLAAEALGRLAKASNHPAFVNSMIQESIDDIVNNREPNSRAGQSLVLGNISSYIGGMASGPHLKNIVGIMHSLASDTHCLVHTWALHSLWLTIDNAGLMYEPYVNSTLTLITKLFMSDTHEETAPQANLPGEDRNTDVLPSFGRILHALVSVLGPELHSSPKVRDLFFSLYEQLKNDSDPVAVAEAIQCVQQFILFAPKLVDIETLVPFLQRKLSIHQQCQVHVMRKAAIHCLYLLSQKDAESVLASSVDGKLEEQLFSLLDLESDLAIQDEIKDILSNFLKHVSAKYPSRWLELCKNILSKGNAEAKPASQPNASHAETADDDGMAMHANEGGEKYEEPQKEQTQQPAKDNIVLVLLPRWKTQMFALVCLRKVLAVAIASGIKEHFDLCLARMKLEQIQPNEPKPDYLIFKLVELIRISFSSSTANLYELKLEGLLLLKDILHKYATIPDPDLPEQLLLEQYHAQITSALAPAFHEENGPELIATACQVCAFYIGSGIQKDTSTLSRLLKLMNAQLEAFNAQVSKETFTNGKMIQRASVLSSWGELYLSSLEQPQLKPIVESNLFILAKCWSAILYEYAKLTLDSELANEFGLQSHETIAGKLDVYVAAVRQVTLQHYQNSWTTIMSALTTLLDNRPDLEKVMHQSDTDQSQTFYVLLGLCIEAISTMGPVGTMQFNPNDALTVSEMATHQKLLKLMKCVEAIGKLSRKLISTKEAFSREIFNEIMAVFDRLMQTEGLDIQKMIIKQLLELIPLLHQDDLTENLQQTIASPHIILGSNDSLNQEKPLDSFNIPKSTKLYKMIKVIYNVFLYHIPGMADTPASACSIVASDVPILISKAFDAFVQLMTLPRVFEEFHGTFLPLALYLFSIALEIESLSHVVGQQVVILSKKLFDLADKFGFLDASYSDIIQLYASSLLDIIPNEDMDILLQKETFVWKCKNALLASTVVITTCPILSFTRENQEILCEILLDALKHPQLQMTACQCIKSLVLLSNQKETISSIGFSYCRLLLPHALMQMQCIALEFQNGHQLESMQWIEEMIKTLMTLYSSMEESKELMFQFNLKMLVNMLYDVPESLIPKFNGIQDRQFFILIAQSLMQLVSQNPESFKRLLSEFSDANRIKLERALKGLSGLQEQSKPRSEKVERNFVTPPPKIQLKNFI